MIYIIDYENVAINGFKGHETLSSDDEVIVFLSPAHKKLDTAMLTNSRAAFRFIGIEPNGHKNYMDFQIVAMCAQFVSKHEKVAIVSNDCGYEAVRDFFHSCKLLNETADVKLVSNLLCDPVEKPIPKKKSERKQLWSTAAEAMRVMNNVDPSDVQTAAATSNIPLNDGESEDTTSSSQKDINKQILLDLSASSGTLGSVSDVIERLPISDEHKTALHNIVREINGKKKGKKVKSKDFIKKLHFLPIASRATCIDALLPYLDLKKKGD